MQRIIRRYKKETGKAEIDMHDVARYAVKIGVRLPKPVDPIDVLAQRFSRAAREEIRHDKRTGHPYRVNHAVPSGQQRFFWIDIDEAPRPKMLKSLTLRREQMVGDALQLSFDADHWNSIHPSERPIDPVLDLTDDVAERKQVWKKAG